MPFAYSHCGPYKQETPTKYMMGAILSAKDITLPHKADLIFGQIFLPQSAGEAQANFQYFQNIQYAGLCAPFAPPPH
jgi:hypothetical protein